MIPKIIHYCWFGGNPLPQDAVECINSWKKYFLNYEIKEWNESNFDINCCDYVKEAYIAKKWAFVSDYARFWILYNYGGVYFDTDVEVIKDFGDIVSKGAFMGCEAQKDSVLECINPGLGIGAFPKMVIYREVVKYYNKRHFDGKCIETIVDHVTRIMQKKGFAGDGKFEIVDDIIVYPFEYFCPLNQWTGVLQVTDKTYSIHHYTASWQGSYLKFKAGVKKILGPNISAVIMKIKRCFRKRK